MITPLLARVSRYAFALTNTEDDAKDLVSEASLKAFEQTDKLRSTEAFCSYLFIVVRRIHVRQLRRARLLNLFKAQIEAPTHDPRSSIDLQLDMTALYRALSQLPAKQRETVMLFEISELSIEEIREIQGGSISGVKSRLRRGRDRLTELLSDTPQPTESKKLAPETTLASQKMAAAYAKINQLIPILLRANRSADTLVSADFILWYQPTKEFLAALPNAVVNKLRTEYNIPDSLGLMHVAQSLSVEHGTITSVAAFPNPAKDKLRVQIKLEAPRVCELVLRDLAGNEVYHHEISQFGSDGDASIDVSQYAEGIYLLEISTDKGERFLQRIVIRK